MLQINKIGPINLLQKYKSSHRFTNLIRPNRCPINIKFRPTCRPNISVHSMFAPKTKESFSEKTIIAITNRTVLDFYIYN